MGYRQPAKFYAEVYIHNTRYHFVFESMPLLTEASLSQNMAHQVTYLQFTNNDILDFAFSAHQHIPSYQWSCRILTEYCQSPRDMKRFWSRWQKVEELLQGCMAVMLLRLFLLSGIVCCIRRTRDRWRCVDTGGDNASGGGHAVHQVGVYEWKQENDRRDDRQRHNRQLPLLSAHSGRTGGLGFVQPENFPWLRSLLLQPQDIQWLGVALAKWLRRLILQSKIEWTGLLPDVEHWHTSFL